MDTTSSVEKGNAFRDLVVSMLEAAGFASESEIRKNFKKVDAIWRRDDIDGPRLHGTETKDYMATLTKTNASTLLMNMVLWSMMELLIALGWYQREKFRRTDARRSMLSADSRLLPTLNFSAGFSVSITICETLWVDTTTRVSLTGIFSCIPTRTCC